MILRETKQKAVLKCKKITTAGFPGSNQSGLRFLLPHRGGVDGEMCGQMDADLLPIFCKSLQNGINAALVKPAASISTLACELQGACQERK